MVLQHGREAGGGGQSERRVLAAKSWEFLLASYFSSARLSTYSPVRRACKSALNSVVRKLQGLNRKSRCRGNSSARYATSLANWVVQTYGRHRGLSYREIIINCRVYPNVCDFTMEDGSGVCYFLEFLPRVSAFQVAIAYADSCKLRFTARRVCWARLTQDGGAREEEIFSWAAHLPELDPASFLDSRSSPPERGPLQLRFKSRGPREGVGQNSKIFPDPPDLSDAPSDIGIECGFCSCRITKPN